MAVKLGLVEQRYKAVIEVLDGAASVTDVARRHGVGRQTVHTWLRRYAAEGLPGLADRSARPGSCPHYHENGTGAEIRRPPRRVEASSGRSPRTPRSG